MKSKILFVVLFSLTLMINTTMAQTTLSESTDDKGMALIEKALKADKKEDPLKVDIDGDALSRQFAQDPKLSTEAFDQKDKNKKVAVIDEKFEKNNLEHIQGLYLCQKIGNAKGAKDCRAKFFKKNK